MGNWGWGMTRQFGAKELWVEKVVPCCHAGLDVLVCHCLVILLVRQESVAWIAGVPSAAADMGCGNCWRACSLQVPVATRLLVVVGAGLKVAVAKHRHG